ncbi:MAG: hypothetical protein ACOCQQ_02550 [Candidatus Nanoarchaeia archaeon]
MKNHEEYECMQFVSQFFKKKNYRLTIPKYTLFNQEKLKEATIEGLLEANTQYKNEHELVSIYNFKIGTNFLNSKIHEIEVQKKIPQLIKATNYARSVSGQYKIFVVSQKLSKKYSINK